MILGEGSDDDSDRCVIDKAVSQEERECKLLTNRMSKMKDKLQHTLRERTNLKLNLKRIQKALREEKKKYRELKKEVDKMADLMKEVDEDEEEDEEDEEDDVSDDNLNLHAHVYNDRIILYRVVQHDTYSLLFLPTLVRVGVHVLHLEILPQPKISDAFNEVQKFSKLIFLTEHVMANPNVTLIWSPKSL